MKARKETLGALCFLAVMGVCFGVLAVRFFQEGELRTAWRTAKQEGGFAALSQSAESAANADLDRDHAFIQIYGGYQRLLGRRVIEDIQNPASTVVKLSDGALNFVNLAPEPGEASLSEIAAGTAALRDALAEAEIPYLYAVAPQKIRDGGQLPAGVESPLLEDCNTVLALLEAEGVEVLDLRPWFESRGEKYGDWFFRTDHHWRPEAAFAAWGVLAEELEGRYGFSFDPALTDEANYSRTVYEDFFLGSQGKRTGSLYAGVDDFTVYTPKFDTDLTYACPLYGMERTGPFETSVCFPERIAERDWFNGNPYTYYAGGDYPLARIVNHKNPNGPKILMIRDSFACALTPFLALGCSEVVTVDLRYFSGDLLETIRAEEPGLVLNLYAVGTVSNTGMFYRPGGEEGTP